MQNDEFKKWLDNLIDIWQNKQPVRILDICADKFLWYETPFEDPISTKQDLVKEWGSVFAQKDINVTYEIVSVKDNIGMAHWNASFTRDTDEKVEMDGIFKIVLNSEGKCTEFRQWYQVK